MFDIKSIDGINQLAHLAVGFFVAVIGTDGPLQGAYVGLAIGLIREHGQMQATGDTSFGENRLLDVLIWTLGGLAGGSL